MTPHRTALRITWIGLLVNLLLGCAKVTGGWALQSKALLADGAHSLLDLLTDIVVPKLFLINHQNSSIHPAFILHNF